MRKQQQQHHRYDASSGGNSSTFAAQQMQHTSVSAVRPLSASSQRIASQRVAVPIPGHPYTFAAPSEAMAAQHAAHQRQLQEDDERLRRMHVQYQQQSLVHQPFAMTAPLSMTNGGNTSTCGSPLRPKCATPPRARHADGGATSAVSFIGEDDRLRRQPLNILNGGDRHDVSATSTDGTCEWWKAPRNTATNAVNPSAPLVVRAQGAGSAQQSTVLGAGYPVGHPQPYCGSPVGKYIAGQTYLVGGEGRGGTYDGYVVAGSGVAAVAAANNRRWFEVGLDSLSRARPPPSSVMHHGVTSAPIVGDSASLLSAIQIQVSMLMDHQHEAMRSALKEFGGHIDNSLSTLDRRVTLLEATCSKVESLVGRELSEARDERNQLQEKLLQVREMRDHAASGLTAAAVGSVAGGGGGGASLRAATPSAATTALRNIVEAVRTSGASQRPNAASPELTAAAAGTKSAAAGGAMQRLMDVMRGNATPPVGAAAATTVTQPGATSGVTVGEVAAAAPAPGAVVGPGPVIAGKVAELSPQSVLNPSSATATAAAAAATGGSSAVGRLGLLLSTMTSTSSGGLAAAPSPIPTVAEIPLAAGKAPTSTAITATTASTASAVDANTKPPVAAMPTVSAVVASPPPTTDAAAAKTDNIVPIAAVGAPPTVTTPPATTTTGDATSLKKDTTGAAVAVAASSTTKEAAPSLPSQQAPPAAASVGAPSAEVSGALKKEPTLVTPAAASVMAGPQLSTSAAPVMDGSILKKEPTLTAAPASTTAATTVVSKPETKAVDGVPPPNPNNSTLTPNGAAPAATPSVSLVGNPSALFSNVQ